MSQVNGIIRTIIVLLATSMLIYVLDTDDPFTKIIILIVGCIIGYATSCNELYKQ